MRSAELSKTKKSTLKPGAGEDAFKKINDMCNDTRKKIKTIISKSKKRKNNLKMQFKQCEKIIIKSYENRLNEDMPEDFILYKKKMKIIKSLPKLNL